MKIVPALLAEKFDVFLTELKNAETFAGYVQIDLMDGVFVQTKSFPPEDLSRLDTILKFEIHLMVADPLGYLEAVRNAGLRRVLFHIEASADPLEVVKAVEERGLDAGIALRPDTTLDRIKRAEEKVGTLLFLTVDPGRYGSPFRPEVLKKVAEARRRYPEKAIAVDGGVSLDNLNRFYDIGVDRVCVGSRIFAHGDPAENYGLFLKKLKELETHDRTSGGTT
jgi:ribulose-phosphate 3-epimerase